jgi:serine/threonine-protein kinase
MARAVEAHRRRSREVSAERDDAGTRGGADELDRGLAAAFGADVRKTLPRPSVLKALQARTGSKLGVHVESQGLEDVPVKVTDEVKALRDPAGRYQLLGEIGRGGMGIVYKGRDQDLGRDVAMKVLKDEYATRADVLARFVEEAQIGGQLQHPGIVPVYELGLQSGERPYFAMKLVKGETLAAQLSKRNSPTDDRRRLLGIFEQVCQTIAYAHARHVVHRDLKPANVMIGAFGEVQVVDWGFAKVLQKGGVADEAAAAKQASQRSVIETVRSRAESGSHSVAGSMMGTPAYMPPEQALGDIARVDERSDVFALGAILCELLTGDAPYREEDGDLVRQAAQARLDGAHERLAKCGAEETLVTLCKECLAPSQRARPASAAELAERVSAYLTSVEERARQSEVRAAEARLKHRVTLLSAGAGLFVVALGLGGWVWLDNQARARRSEAAQRVSTAMSAVSGARGKAQSAGVDMGVWSTAVSSAEQLVSLAKSDDVDATTRADAEAMLAAVQDESRAANAESERRKRDTTMRNQLEFARIPADEDMRVNALKELRRLDAAYSEAFTTYLGGASLLGQPVETTLALLRRSDNQIELAGSLDHWGLVRDGLKTETDAPDAAGTARIRDIAMQLDGGDAWRKELRALLPKAGTESTRLRKLAAEADFTALTAVGCRVLSQALWSAGERETAIAVLRRGQELHSQDFDLCFQLAIGLDLLEEPRPLEAIASYRIAHAIRPEQNEVLHRQILAMEGLRLHVDAERVSRLLIARDPSNTHWLHHLGNALNGQGRFDDAIACYRKWIEMTPRNALAYANLGVDLQRQGKLEDALASLRRAIELDPKDPSAHANLGIVLRDQGKLDEAIASFRRAIDLDPTNAPALSDLGDTLVTKGDLVAGMSALRKAVALEPKNARAMSNLGVALHTQGKLDEAIALFRSAVELEPKFADAHENLGALLAERNEPGAAIESLQRAIELDPKIASAHARLGDVLKQQGEFDQAIESYRRAVELDPRDTREQNSLGSLLRKQGNPEAALECFQRVLAIDPRHAAATLNVGICLTDRGDFERALEQFHKAADLFAEDTSPFGRDWLERTQSFIAIAERRLEQRRPLDDVLTGRAAVSSAEWEAAVEFGCQQRRCREVVELTVRTLVDAPELIDSDLGTYNSACAAALLAASTAADVTADERVRARELARTWLQRDIDRWSAQLGGGGSEGSTARARLTHALEDPDFASVRGDKIDSLPEAVRAAWRELWTRIATGASTGASK